MRDDTLIVSATYDDAFPDWYEQLPEPKVRVSTAGGGHPSQAFINAFRDDRRKHRAYLFLQDSLEPMMDEVTIPFEAVAATTKADIVGWARFPLFFDTPEQEHRVAAQYAWVQRPQWGIFGPIFWATRKVMERMEKQYRFPLAPEDKIQAQGTERAWAFAANAVAAKVSFLHDWDNTFLTSGDALPFKKFFAGRQ